MSLRRFPEYADVKTLKTPETVLSFHRTVSCENTTAQDLFKDFRVRSTLEAVARNGIILDEVFFERETGNFKSLLYWMES